jgi:hypothetical protein
MDKQTLIFLFLLTVFAICCLRESRRWLEEGSDRIQRRLAGDRCAFGDGSAAGIDSEGLTVNVANEGGKSMASFYNESFHQIDELCCELHMLVETARSSELQGDGGMLAYGWISECAARIRMNAEERRQLLARAHLEETLSDDLNCLDVVGWRRDF